MGTFKEINKADGSGTTLFYRASYANTFDISDLDIDTESVLYRTGLEISQMTEDKPAIVLCTEDYVYTDQYGSLMSVERGTIYEMDHGTIVDTIAIGGGGGGGGTPRSNLTTAISPLEQNVSIKATVKLAYHFLTTAINKNGTAKLYVNNVLKNTTQVTSGEDYEFNVTPYLKLGTNYFTIRTADNNGAEKTIDFLVNGVQLILSSNFNDELPMPDSFDYIYRVRGAGDKTIHFILDGEEITYTTSASDIDLTQHFTSIGHGSHTLQVYVTAILDGSSLISNSLNYSLLTYNPESSDIIMASNFNISSCMEGEHLKIDYKVYNPASLTSNVEMYINDESVMSVIADRTQHVWNVSNYPTGTVTFKIQCGDIYIEKVVEVEPISVEIHEVTEGLELKLTTANRSNQEAPETRSIWRYEDIAVQMNNFNWVSNGWIDNKLKLNGSANAVIPFCPFESDLRRTGKTIEIGFVTHNVFDLNSVLLTCLDDRGIGCEIKMDQTRFSSEQQTVTTRFGEDNEIRISFVVEPVGSNRLIKTYINGVLSGLTQYANDDNFEQANPFNIVINPDQEEIDITCIRVYNRALTSREIVDNWIYDMTDVSAKISTFNNNQIYDYYGNVSYAKVKNYLPVVIITGPMPTYKGDKKQVTIRYEHNSKEQYNFEQENCTIDVQGTSSQYYPRKNWKIKLQDKVQVEDNMLQEKTYCMKADFMESSHMYNIGTAKLVNDLYDEQYYYPTRTKDNGVRDALYGFPCVLFTQETIEDDLQFAGTFMFNNDKSDKDTLGFTTEHSESWEFKNNTSDHCLFKTDDFSPSSGVDDNFEARYPDDSYRDYTALQRVFSWVVSCRNNPTKFREEFEQYFSLHYCLIYQVMMELAIMVDSRAKNMFLDTADGIIWYPRFYDMDTCWGLNNEGVPAWNYDVEIHDRNGSAYVWDDRGESVFWNLFEEAFADEIAQTYRDLRSNKLTYENIMRYYVTDISDKFAASEYNEDSEFKYVQPLTQQGNATYLYAAQGSRQDYFKWMVKNRLKLLDSKYEYGDYNSDYVTMRLYTTNGNFTITVHQTMYIKARFGSTTIRQKVNRDEPTTILAPAGLVFNDTEVILWGASAITDLGDLTNKYPGTVDISKCTQLQVLRLGSNNSTNTNLISLSLGNVPMLREIYITNCPNLTGNLDMSGCTDLKIVNARGTGITSFTLPENTIIEEMYLPKTLTSLTLKNVHTLNTLVIESMYNIKNLIYENSTYSLDELLTKCGGLTRMRLVLSNDYSYTMDFDGFMYYHNNIMGIDDQGFNLPHPNISGTITLNVQNYHTAEEINDWKAIVAEWYPLLDVHYVDTASIYTQFTYFGKQNANASSVYTYLGNGLFDYRTYTSEEGTRVVTVPRYTNSNTPMAQPPEWAEYVWVRLNPKLLTTVQVLTLPETISELPVAGFTLSVTYQNDGEKVGGVIIPRTYRMFDIDFYTEYNLYYNYQPVSSMYGYFPCLNMVKLTDSTYMIRNPYYLFASGATSDGGYHFINLNSIVFSGKTNILPLISGSLLYTYFDTSQALVAGNNFPYSRLTYPARAPYWPLHFDDYHNIYLSGSYKFQSPEFYILPNTLNLYGSGALYGNYTGDLDLSNSNIIFASNNISFCSSGTFNTLVLNAQIRSLYNIGPNLIINHPFDASSIITSGNMQSLDLSYTTVENPQSFPNLEVINSSNGWVHQDGYYPRDMYLSTPKLRQITCGSAYSGASTCVYLDIPSDRILKLVGFDYVSTSNSDVILGPNKMNVTLTPCIKNGFDCSALPMRNSYRISNLPSEFGGYWDLGASFASNGGLVYIQGISGTNEQKHQVLLNIFNSIYDLTEKNLTGTIRLVSALYNLLTSEDIAIATSKGWTVRT